MCRCSADLALVQRCHLGLGVVRPLAEVVEGWVSVCGLCPLLVCCGGRDRWWSDLAALSLVLGEESVHGGDRRGDLVVLGNEIGHGLEVR